jgi:hypothetical protein
MGRLGIGIVVALLGLTACATARPPGVRITDVAVLAGTYTGSINEFELPSRPVRMVFHPDGSFEITAAEPRGFRFNGRAVASADGSLVYSYDQDRNTGRGVVYEGGGRRQIVLDSANGRATITVDRPLP